MVRSGHQSRASGKAAENQVDFLHQIYNAHRLALVRHNGTSAEMRDDEWVPLESPPDYEGAITKYGARHVAFDLKYRTSLGYSHPKDKLHQSDYLWRMQEAGAVSFILLWIETAKFSGGFALLPQPYWQEYYGKGWSINPINLAPSTIQFDGVDSRLRLAIPIPRWERVSPGYVPDWIQIVPQFSERITLPPGAMG